MIKKTYLLNSPILTAFGAYQYHELDLETAKSFMNDDNRMLISAIGHQPTADFLTQLLGRFVAMNRIQITMQTGETALVFKVKARLEEGKILTQTELENTEIEFGLLEKIN